MITQLKIHWCTVTAAAASVWATSVLGNPVVADAAFGGLKFDGLRVQRALPDGGRLIGGYSASDADGNKSSAAHGGYDFYVVRLAASGDVLWQRSYGGTGNDILVAIEPAGDGGFLLAGNSDSGADRDKSAAPLGTQDFWVVRIDGAGARLWDRAYGGTGLEALESLLPLPGGEFLLAGTSGRGNPTYDDDFRAVRIGSDGSLLWDRTVGGVAGDSLVDVLPTPDGGFILAGSSSSPASDSKTSALLGFTDFWVVRLAADGQVLWDKSFGASDRDDLTGVLATLDGGFLLFGDTSTKPFSEATTGSSDFRVVRIDTNGNELWDATYGGGEDDELVGVVRLPDGGFVLGGNSRSEALFSKSAPALGGWDFWAVGIDSQGIQQWDRSFGGAGMDVLELVGVSADGVIALAGSSSSGVDSAKSAPNYGAYDYWTVWIEPDGSVIEDASYGGESLDFVGTLGLDAQGRWLLGGNSASAASGNKASAGYGVFDFWGVTAGSVAYPLRIKNPRRIEGGEVEFRVTGKSGQAFGLQESAILGGWRLMTSGVIGAGTGLFRQPLDTAAAGKFFRVVPE